MQVGYPDKVMLPGAFDSGMLCIVILASFFGQMLLNHGFQIQSAAKGSSINCTQVKSFFHAGHMVCSSYILSASA